jgi:hypothetical protein
MVSYMTGFGKTQFLRQRSKSMASDRDRDSFKRPLALNIALVFLALEGLVVAGFALTTLSQIFMGQSRSISTAMALFAIVAAAAAAVFFIAIALSRGKRWARSAAVFWQLVQLSVAAGSFTGETPNAAIGWALIVPSAVVMILLFRNEVIDATMREVDKDDQ